MVFESGREWQIDRPLPSSPSRQMEPFLPSSPDKTGLINGTIRTWNVKPSSCPPNLCLAECDAADGRTKGNSRFSEKAKSAIAVIHVQNSGIYCLDVLRGWARK